MTHTRFSARATHWRMICHTCTGQALTHVGRRSRVLPALSLAAASSAAAMAVIIASDSALRDPGAGPGTQPGPPKTTYDGLRAPKSRTWANFAPTWANLGPTWANLGPTWPQELSQVGRRELRKSTFWPSWLHVGGGQGGILAPRYDFGKHLGAILLPTWPNFGKNGPRSLQLGANMTSNLLLRPNILSTWPGGMREAMK